ncbi:hypothetical protein ASG01_09370 [Chryseobacterium sp. Leaf180]|nr:hypothetical protein ASG01_09370 [Chryseobacterium sp. Leaf180]
MVIVLATIYAMIYHLLNLNDRPTLDQSSELIVEKVFEHYYWFVVATIPIYALTTFIMFKKTGYNFFFEFIIFEAFKTSQSLVVHILFLPVLYFFKDRSVFNTISHLLLVLDFILILWINKQFFKNLSLSQVLIKSLASYLMYLILSLILIVIIIILFGLDR